MAFTIKAVNSPLTDAPNSGPLPNNGHCLMYQLNSLWFMYTVKPEMLAPEIFSVFSITKDWQPLILAFI